MVTSLFLTQKTRVRVLFGEPECLSSTQLTLEYPGKLSKRNKYPIVWWIWCSGSARLIVAQ